ncbi:MAG TPA: MFS transporter [Polyangiaceae bacterium]|nr:MFS transporter [Polyangiaceae bacterium]
MTGARDKRGYATAFGLTWFAYATYYLGRKGFSVTKSRIAAELALRPEMLATIDTGFLVAYAVGQVANGFLGDRIGARRLVAFGMLASALACLAFGNAAGAALLFIAFAVNGFAQSTGWPGTTKGIAEWTNPQKRGAIMGAWCTCYQVGGIAATAFASWLLGHYGWRSAFVVPALCIALVGLVVLLALRPGPYATPGPRSRLNLSIFATLKSPTLLSYGAAYFFIKLIRYSFLFWLPYYLHTALSVGEVNAGYLSTSFEVGGVAGAVVIGVVSDRFGPEARSIVAAVALVGLAVALFVYGQVGSSSLIAQFMSMAAIGALLFGPDALVSAAAAQDAAGPDSAASAAGLVNGIGSLGAILQGYVTVGVSRAYGWSVLFYLFVGFALLSAISLTPTFRKRPVALPAAGG